MNYDEARQLIATVKQTNEIADTIASDIAQLLVGRLRKIRYPSVLRALKKELSNYDMTTSRWKP